MKQKIIQSQYLTRKNIGDDRFYCLTLPDEDIITFPSVTTILKATMPTSEYLIKWISEHGYQKAQQIAMQKADYGTLMHILISQYLDYKTYDFDSLVCDIENFASEKKIDYDISFWKYELKKDILAFHCFANNFDLDPLATSLMLYNTEYMVAGELDLVCSLKIGTGVNGNILKKDLILNENNEIVEDNRISINCIIDLKSGRKGFYPTHAAQLQMYSFMFKKLYPDIQINKLYNWAPKDWQKTPSWHLKDQTESTEKEKYMHYIEIYHKDHIPAADRILPIIQGTIELGKLENNNLTYTNLSNLLMEL